MGSLVVVGGGRVLNSSRGGSGGRRVLNFSRG